ncbi:DUF3747 domain-containing protein [Pleurocapsales cyanobacterium LEGE 06147]|nr:DUF3747 domain-containing protein [Pleurocapsales cyanobacterium LEGE 06147]
MKFAQKIKLFTLTLSVFTSTMLVSSPKAVSFEEQRVNPGQFLLVAVPFGYKEHRLEIIEQIPGRQKCWQESGTNPVAVDLVLLNFDHTDSCKRIANSNGYSLRINGQDEKVAYILKIVERSGELQLIASHKDPKQPELVIGRTYGLGDSPLKIRLNPGWQITKRVHQGNVIEHVYLSGSSTTAQTPNSLDLTNSTFSFSNPSNFNTSSTTTDSFSSSPQPNPTAIPNTTQTTPPILDGNFLIDGVSQVYNSLINPIMGSFIGGVQTNPSPNPNSCQGTQPGTAIVSKSGIAPQRVAILADGTLQLSDGRQLNIKPALAQNGINPEQFLAGPNEIQLDLDGDGQPEGLKIEQPPQACASAGY